MQMIRQISLALVALLLVACTNPFASLLETSVVRVGTYELSQTELDDRVARLKTGLEKNPNVTDLPADSELRDYMIDQFVVQHVVINLANEAGITVTDAEIDAQVEEFRTAVADSGSGDFDTVISEQLGFASGEDPGFRAFCEYFLLQERYAQSLVTEDEVRAELRARYEEQAKSTELKANSAHILVADEALALSLLERINAGEDFGALAAEFSEDPGSKETGGELGWVGKGQFVPEFEQAIFDDLQVGEVTQVPVKSDFGYHIIKLLGREDRPLMDAADIDEEVASQLEIVLDDRRYTQLYQNIDSARANGEAEGTIVAPTPVATEVPAVEP
jgi:parvulin-like peptidyl-prolyl isomerase